MASPVLLGSVLRSKAAVDIVNDLTPELGGDLDANGFDIINVGNLGVGTSTPGAHLHVYENGAGTAATARIESATGNSGIEIYAGGTNADQAYIQFVQGGGTAWSDSCEIRQVSNNLLLTSRHASGAIVLQTASTERMRVTSAGRVGIATDAPDVALHILGSGGVVTSGVTQSSADHQLFLENASNYTQIGLSCDNTYGGFLTSNATTDNATWIGWYGSSAGGSYNDVAEWASNGDWYFYHNTNGWVARVEGAGSLFLKERAGAGAATSVAGYGQLWIKNTTPCELWFTDDAGTSTKIA